MQPNIDDFLVEGLKQGNFAHAWMVEAQIYQSNSAALESWLQKILQRAFDLQGNMANHPDICLVATESGKLKKDELKDISDFLKTKAINLPKKVVVFADVAKLSVSVQNKLLKILEEPPVPTYFFLLNPTRVKLLTTINSRVQKIKVVTQYAPPETPDLAQCQQMDFWSFQEKFKDDPNTLRDLIESLNRVTPEKASAVSDLAQILQSFDKDIMLHNSTNYLSFKTYRWIQKYVT